MIAACPRATCRWLAWPHTSSGCCAGPPLPAARCAGGPHRCDRVALRDAQPLVGDGGLQAAAHQLVAPPSVEGAEVHASFDRAPERAESSVLGAVRAGPRGGRPQSSRRPRPSTGSWFCAQRLTAGRKTARQGWRAQVGEHGDGHRRQACHRGEARRREVGRTAGRLSQCARRLGGVFPGWGRAFSRVRKVAAVAWLDDETTDRAVFAPVQGIRSARAKRAKKAPAQPAEGQRSERVAHRLAHPMIGQRHRDRIDHALCAPWDG